MCPNVPNALPYAEACHQTQAFAYGRTYILFGIMTRHLNYRLQSLQCRIILPTRTCVRPNVLPYAEACPNHHSRERRDGTQPINTPIPTNYKRKCVRTAQTNQKPKACEDDKRRRPVFGVVWVDVFRSGKGLGSLVHWGRHIYNDVKSK